MNFSLYKNCFPNESQLLLIKAALIEDERALVCWNEWCSKEDFENTDHETYKIYPLVYHNLKKLGSSESIELKRFRGAFKYQWVKNKAIIFKISIVLKALRAQSLDLCVFKGITLARKIYEHDGLRPMVDVDIAIHHSDLEKVKKILNSFGFKSGSEANLNYFDFRHAIAFSDQNGYQIDLHVSFLKEGISKQHRYWHWEETESFSFDTFDVSTLNDSDSLLISLLHGLRNYNGDVGIRWIIDSALLIRRTDIDWNRFLEGLKLYGIYTRALLGLNFLIKELNVEIPNWVISELSNPFNREVDNLDLKYNLSSGKSLRWKISSSWAHFRKIKSHNASLKFSDFLWFFIYNNGLFHISDIPKYFYSKIID